MHAEHSPLLFGNDVTNASKLFCQPSDLSTRAGGRTPRLTPTVPPPRCTDQPRPERTRRSVRSVHQARASR